MDFGSDILPDTQPISIIQYRKDQTELKEFKDQLKDILHKGFI